MRRPSTAPPPLQGGTTTLNTMLNFSIDKHNPDILNVHQGQNIIGTFSPDSFGFLFYIPTSLAPLSTDEVLHLSHELSLCNSKQDEAARHFFKTINKP